MAVLDEELREKFEHVLLIRNPNSVKPSLADVHALATQVLKDAFDDGLFKYELSQKVLITME